MGDTQKEDDAQPTQPATLDKSAQDLMGWVTFLIAGLIACIVGFSALAWAGEYAIVGFVLIALGFILLGIFTLGAVLTLRQIL